VVGDHYVDIAVEQGLPGTSSHSRRPEDPAGIPELEPPSGTTIR
jgi:hypothetical protein